MKAKCSNCEKNITRLKADTVEIDAASGQRVSGYVLTCPHCHVLITAAFDPRVINAMPK